LNADNKDGLNKKVIFGVPAIVSVVIVTLLAFSIYKRKINNKGAFLTHKAFYIHNILYLFKLNFKVKR